MKKISILVFGILLLYVQGMGQAAKDNKKGAFAGAADSISKAPAKSGLSYSALTQFFQSTITTGQDGGYDFKTTWFNIHKLFKDSALLQVSDFYNSKRKGIFQRNFEINLGLHKDTGGNYNVVGAGIKYAIVNRRDRSNVNIFSYLGKQLGVFNTYRSDATTDYLKYLNSLPADSAEKLRNELHTAETNFRKTNDPTVLPKMVLDETDSLLEQKYHQNSVDFLTATQKNYDSIAKRIDQRGLLTISANSGYDAGASKYGNSTLLLQYLKGIGDSIYNPMEIDAQAKYQWINDTSAAGKGKTLSRSLGILSLGLNKVFIRSSDNNPLLEFELALEYDRVTNGRYPGEDRDKKMGVGILRLHISKSLSLPVTVKYAPEDHNFLGILQVQWNFESR